MGTVSENGMPTSVVTKTEIIVNVMVPIVYGKGWLFGANGGHG